MCPTPPYVWVALHLRDILYVAPNLHPRAVSGGASYEGGGSQPKPIRGPLTLPPIPIPHGTKVCYSQTNDRQNPPVVSHWPWASWRRRSTDSTDDFIGDGRQRYRMGRPDGAEISRAAEFLARAIVGSAIGTQENCTLA